MIQEPRERHQRASPEPVRPTTSPAILFGFRDSFYFAPLTLPDFLPWADPAGRVKWHGFATITAKAAKGPSDLSASCLLIGVLQRKALGRLLNSWIRASLRLFPASCRLDHCLRGHAPTTGTPLAPTCRSGMRPCFFGPRHDAGSAYLWSRHTYSRGTFNFRYRALHNTPM
jgi:hypothetical protein